MPQNTRPRHFAISETLSSVTDVRAELLQSVTKLVKGCPPTKPWNASFLEGRCGGLFTGPTSIALLFFHLARSHPKLEICGKAPSYWCGEYLACSSGPSKSGPATLQEGCGITNEFLVFHVLEAILKQDETHGKLVVEALSTAQIERDLNEWMKGRAGALYLLRLLKTYMPPTSDFIQPVQTGLIKQVLDTRPWTFHGKRYIGAVHGDIGIITQAVLTDPSTAPSFEADLIALLDVQEEDGNWRSHPDGNSLIQFCHGAPGFIFSLERLRKHYPQHQGRIDAAIGLARKCTWEKGLLTKEPSLCHGASGNALALEGAQLEHFMAEAAPGRITPRMEAGEYEMSYDPWGLLWGEAGRVWSWAILDDRRNGIDELHGVISYTDV